MLQAMVSIRKLNMRLVLPSKSGSFKERADVSTIRGLQYGPLTTQALLLKQKTTQMSWRATLRVSYIVLVLEITGEQVAPLVLAVSEVDGKRWNRGKLCTHFLPVTTQ